MRTIDKQQVAALWKEVFHDSDKFINLFFGHVYRPENTLVYEKDNKIISALQMVPYEMKIDNNIVSCAYVCGVCTHPSEQGHGYMKTLMQEAMDSMRKRGYALTTLIPAETWLFDFYKQFGYVVPINKSIESYTRDKNQKPAKYTITTCSDEKYFGYFDGKQRERQCTILHNVQDFETIRLDCNIEGGNVWIALENNRPTGMAFEFPQSNSKIYIKELFYDNEIAKNELIQHILNNHNANTAKVHVPFITQRNTHSYGITCILDKKIEVTALRNAYMSLMLD